MLTLIIECSNRLAFSVLNHRLVSNHYSYHLQAENIVLFEDLSVEKKENSNNKEKVNELKIELDSLIEVNVYLA